jgi:hypothetical protein
VNTTITVGGNAVQFDEEEWIVAQHLYGSNPGPGSVFMFGGDLTPEAFVHIQSIFARWHGWQQRREKRPIDTKSLGFQLFELIKNKWKVPYVKHFDSDTIVFVGTKRLGSSEDDPSLLERVPSLTELPVVAATLTKLEFLFPKDSPPLPGNVSLAKPVDDFF